MSDGSESFVRDQLPHLIDLCRARAAGVASGAPESELKGSVTTGSSKVTLGMNSLAARFDVKSGSDLLLTAAYSLTGQGSDTANRAGLLSEMKKATSYFKESYTGNLTKYLSTLVKDGKLLQQSNDQYALSASAANEISAKFSLG
jgi:hypothetical protein